MSNREAIIKSSSMRKEPALSDRRRAWPCLASKIRRRSFDDTSSAFEEQRHEIQVAMRSRVTECFTKSVSLGY